MKDFLATLNPAQQEAVTHTEGPLLIVAGAGTGKTRVLTHRLLYLIESKQVRPEEILALTFTEKAALEMQERMDILLPYGYSELWIKTFHGFCDAILRERAYEIGLDPHYRLLSQTEAALFLKTHLFELELDYFRPLGNPLRFVRSLSEFFGHLLDERIDAARYQTTAEELHRNATDAAGTETAQKHLELSHAYARYLALLPQHGFLDFANLQSLALQLFEQHPSVLSAYQKRFRYVMVDEFQDTNTAQNHLVKLLTARDHNVMVVGDDDQSIYQWRGASLTNILNFEKHFPQAKKVVLTTNYRSTQPILDASYALIQHNNPHRLEIKDQLPKRLNSVDAASLPPKPHVVHFQHYSQEVQFVLEQIERSLKEGHHRPRDFAILVRASQHAIPFVEALTRQGFPTHFSGAQGLYQREEIKDLLAVLRVLVNPSDTIALFRLLSLPLWGFEMEFLLQLTHQAKSTTTSLLNVLRAQRERPTLFSGAGAESPIERFLTLFEELQALVPSAPTSQILGHFLKHSGYLTALETREVLEHLPILESVGAFSQHIKTFEETHPDGRLLSCWEYLSDRFELGDREMNAETPEDSDAIKVFTLHAAKGLEFETVFLVDLVQHRFPSMDRSPAFEIPETLLDSSLAPDSLSHLNEERRLFYVGMTRAKRHLFLTYSDRYEGPKHWKSSVFVEELTRSDSVDVTEDGQKLLQNPSPIQLAAADSLEGKPLIFTYERTHRPLSLSFSRLQTFEDCPLKYKFRYVYHLSEPPSHATSFGSSVHNALNAYYREVKKGAKPSLALLKRFYVEHWIPMGYVSADHCEARKKQGWEMLERFYEAEAKDLRIPFLLEQPFTLKTPSGLTLSGRIDRIDRLPDGTYEVIDYKTGERKESLNLSKDLQLSIYALACEQVLKLPVSRLSLYYLAQPEKVSTVRTVEQLRSTESELDQLSRALADSPLEATPSPMVCRRCDYRLLCAKAML